MEVYDRKRRVSIYIERFITGKKVGWTTFGDC